MTTNIERAANLFQDALEEPHMYPAGEMAMYAAQALADAGLLMPDDMETQYGVWHKYPSEEEAISWEDNGKDLSGMAENMRKAGLKAERVARHVSTHRFITMTEEPK